MVTANPDGSGLYCLSDHGMVSHSCWRDNSQIIAWARQPEGDKYWIFEDLKGCVGSFGAGVLVRDGHPSFSPNGRWLLTDTYPGRSRRASLILFDVYDQRKYCLGKYLAPMGYDGPTRCDLHPRWSRDGSAICFDSTHEGSRGVYIVELDDFLNVHNRSNTSSMEQ